jgi:succinylarginine dihydrolase
LETATTRGVLKRIFDDPQYFAHHDPLPAGMSFSDEGAANHTRLWWNPNDIGLQIFTYGRDVNDAPQTNFPARQTLQASESIARLHQLDPFHMLFFKQNPEAIDAGAFHNDVVALGHSNVLLIHELAWEMQAVALRQVEEIFQRLGGQLHVLQIASKDLSLGDAIKTYMFNSQIVTLPDRSMALIAPLECREHAQALRVIDDIIAGDNPIRTVHYVDVRQSMRNGGGPACLRLRVMLNRRELEAMNPDVMLTDALYKRLREWVERHYRDRLTADELADPKLLRESRRALDELTSILDLGNIYSFQK